MYDTKKGPSPRVEQSLVVTFRLSWQQQVTMSMEYEVYEYIREFKYMNMSTKYGVWSMEYGVWSMEYSKTRRDFRDHAEKKKTEKTTNNSCNPCRLGHLTLTEREREAKRKKGLSSV